MTTTADTDTGSLDIWGASQLHVLSVGRGHLTLQITPGNTEEIERARKVITEMLERGYVIFVEDADGSATYRVQSFNPAKMVYIINDPEPDEQPAEPVLGAPPPTTGDEPEVDPRAVRKAAKKARKATKEVPVSTAKATAVGRTAGG